MDDATKKAKLKKLAELLKNARSKSQQKRLNVELDRLLGIESSPEEDDDELGEAWERSRHGTEE